MDLRGEKGIRICYSGGNSSSILVGREERVTHTFGQTNVGNEEIHGVGVYSGLANNTQGSGEHAPTSNYHGRTRIKSSTRTMLEQRCDVCRRELCRSCSQHGETDQVIAPLATIYNVSLPSMRLVLQTDGQHL